MPLLKNSSIRPHGRAAALACLLLLLGWCAPVPAPAQAAGSSEYALKAACMFNFCQFITWPSDAFEGPAAPIVIGVLGNDPFGTMLDDVVRGEVIRGRTIRVSRYRRVEEAANCHLLFVSGSEAPRQDVILRFIQRRKIVTIGESDDFLAGGGMIALASVQNRVRLRINLPAVRAGGISVSSKLLRVADIVQ